MGSTGGRRAAARPWTQRCGADRDRPLRRPAGGRQGAVLWRANHDGQLQHRFDPKPLISTTIVTTAPRTCLFVDFSALVEPQDNHVMFQVRVNGAPMEGHAIFPYSVPTVKAPVVWDPEETDKNLTRMVAYTFFDAVGPGNHTVDVRFAGCCGLTGGVNVISLVRNSVLKVHY
jgi:hypothetical protein